MNGINANTCFIGDRPTDGRGFEPSYQCRGKKVTKEELISAELPEVRCKGIQKNNFPCRKLLGKIKGTYEIKCTRCGTINKG
jgi:LSD1 subclass zinc finger protein